MKTFNQILLDIITANPACKTSFIHAEVKEITGIPVSLVTIRKTLREMVLTDEIHHVKKLNPKVNGWFAGKRPPKPVKAPALPKYMYDNESNLPLKTYPRPGVMRVRMAHIGVGEKPAKAIGRGIGSSFAMYDGL